MRKLSYLTLFSIVFLFFSAIVTSLTGMIRFKSAWIPLIIAFAILILSTVLSVVCRDNLNGKSLFMTALNSIALGFAIRAWYIFRNINNPVRVLLPVALAASAVLIIFYAISLIPFVDRHYSVFFWILSALILALYITVAALTRTTFMSTFGFYLIFTWTLTLCMCNCSEFESLYTQMLIASFSIWVVAIIILLLMLDGDGFDLDFVDLVPSSPNVKTRIKKKKFKQIV